jgi:hypothetical protein
MIHCTTYTDSQGKPLGYFMEFQNVTEEDRNGNIRPVCFAKEFTDPEEMRICAEHFADRYCQGIVYKTVIDPDYLA